MNDKIFDLAVQAGITTNIDTDYFEKDTSKWLEYYSGKFAGLILQQVNDIIDQAYRDLPLEIAVHLLPIAQQIDELQNEN